MEPRVRLATAADVDAVVAISARVQAALTASGSLQQFGPILRETVAAHVACGSALVLAGHGALLGGVLVESEHAPVTPDLERIFQALSLPAAEGPRWWLQKLMVDPAWQGRGLGLRLLEAARRRVVGGGGGLLALDCWAGNGRLRAFYLAAGFSFHGEYREEDFSVSAFTWRAPGPARPPERGVFGR